MLFHVLGGLGLFLLGMSVMTQGLRSLGDVQLRHALARMTQSPFTGVLTGFGITALLQSSSATTVAAVGLVEAGLITFSQALGVIFGATVGTTMTGWLVALLGFKVRLGELALPLVFAGALMRLLGKNRIGGGGSALAGFGLIFVGITMLQDGMGAASAHVTPESFPPDTFVGRLLLVLIGVVITLLTQSSSVGVATALAAVHAGAVTLSQAAAMVIGMNLGTAFTAVLATIGGKAASRRTGLAHVIYNTLVGVGGFILLTPYLLSIDFLLPGARLREPELVLVGFHTFFTLIGVMVAVPFTHRYAQFIESLIPEKGNLLTRRLDPLLVRTPDLALGAVTATLADLTQAEFQELQRRLPPRPSFLVATPSLEPIEEAIQATTDYLQQLDVTPGTPDRYAHYLAALQTCDHLQRLTRRMKDAARIQQLHDDARLEELARRLLELTERFLQGPFPPEPALVDALKTNNRNFKQAMKRFRETALAEVAGRQLPPAEALARMDSVRWLRRVAYHLWQIGESLSAGPNREQSTEPPLTPE